MGNQQNCME